MAGNAASQGTGQMRNGGQLLVESLVALGKRTGKTGAYAPRSADKEWAGPTLGSLRAFV